jgi:hypothetical protein
MILPNPFTNSKNAIFCQCFRRQSIRDACKTLQGLHRRRSCNLSTHDCQDISSAYSQQSSFSNFEHWKVGIQKTSVVVTIGSATWLNLFSWIKLTPIVSLPVQLTNTLESNAWYHCTNSHKYPPHVMYHIPICIYTHVGISVLERVYNEVKLQNWSFRRLLGGLCAAIQWPNCHTRGWSKIYFYTNMDVKIIFPKKPHMAWDVYIYIIVISI